MTGNSIRLTKIYIHLDRLTHNIGLLQECVSNRSVWPCIKANAYGHGSEIVARHLESLGYHILGVADVEEGMALVKAGIQATYIVLSETLPEHSEALVRHGFEPTISTLTVAEALSREAIKMGCHIHVHIKVDTGMGRVGIQPNEMKSFLERCQSLDGLRVRGVMSHFPRADEADKSFSFEQIERFKKVVEETKSYGIETYHMANSAAIFDLPDSYFDAVRPGIAIYGLRPSWDMVNPRVGELLPIMDWKTRIVFLKEVPAGQGLSYGHSYHTKRQSLIATIPVGYGDGLNRNLSNNFDVLVGGIRCPQVGRITMDMTLIDVTELRGKVELGDEVVIIGQQGAEELTADELAGKLGTINYEIVTCISQRVPRVAGHNEDIRM
jgi:alanine racemase